MKSRLPVPLFLVVLGCGTTSPSADPLPWDGAVDGRRPPVGLFTFTDLVESIAPGVGACAPWDGTPCYNDTLPPRPSTMRSLVAHRSAFELTPLGEAAAKIPVELRCADNTVTPNVRNFSAKPLDEAGGQTYTLGHRTSVDGRIHLLEAGHEPKIGPIYPENLDYGFQTRPGRDVHPRDQTGRLHGFMVMGGETAHDLAALGDAEPHYPFTGGTDLCSHGEDSLPYACAAPLESGDVPLDGLCWDLSVLSMFGEQGKGEMRSNEITVFVEEGDVIPVTDADVDREVWIYPTAAVDRFGEAVGERIVLPPFAGFADGEGVYDGIGSVGVDRWRAAERMATRCAPLLDDGDELVPDWCWYFVRQEYVSLPDVMYEPGSTNFRPIEVSTTGDGHVIVGSDARVGGIGLFYSYSPDPCDASGWTTVKPLSEAYHDEDVNERYGFAAYPLTAPDGTPIARGTLLSGNYSWVDRRGANIFLGSDVHPAGWAECGNTARADSSDACDSLRVVPQKNAKSPKVVGLWTRGKVVHLDGVLNQVDYTVDESVADPVRPEVAGGPFSLALFDDAPAEMVWPGNNVDFFTYENLFAHVDTLSPILPADVVWSVTTTGVTRGNPVIGEVAFDDYLTRGASIIAPMNDRLSLVQPPESRPQTWFRENGMSRNDAHEVSIVIEEEVPVGEGRPSFVEVWSGGDVRDSSEEAFTGEGIFLQNNAPLTNGDPDGPPLPVLELQGGAFIPPASTGVIGKAVYLDGVDDRITITDVTPMERFYLGLWVELHHDDARTLVTFSDGTRLVVKPDHVRLEVDGLDDVEWVTPGLIQSEWHHVALAVAPGDGARLRLYIDGQPVGGERAADVAPDGWIQLGFTIGVPTEPDGTPPPTAAWVDELKLFELQEGDFDAQMLEELACNRALGSVKGDVCEQLDFRQLEVLDACDVGSGLEFPKDTYAPGSCAAGAHRNTPGLACERATLLGIEPIDPNQPRPAADANAFCLTCHDDSRPSSPMHQKGRFHGFDLSIDALEYDPTTPARDDLRRQPMHWTPEWDDVLANGRGDSFRLPDPARVERCDTLDNDGDGVADIGCGVCTDPGEVELGRVMMHASRENVHRTPDGYWSAEVPRQTLDLSPAGMAAACAGFPTSDPAEVNGVRIAPDASVDLKPFTDGSGAARFETGAEEVVCCGPPRIDLDVHLDPGAGPAPVAFDVTCSTGVTSTATPYVDTSRICGPGDLDVAFDHVDLVTGFCVLSTDGGPPTMWTGGCVAGSCAGSFALDDAVEAVLECEYLVSGGFGL